MTVFGKKNWGGRAAVLVVLCAVCSCTTAPEDAQLQALNGTWEITELETSGGVGNATEALRSFYEEPPTLTVETGDPARYTVAGTPASESDPLRIEGEVREVDVERVAFVSGFDTEIVWRLDIQTGTRAYLMSGPGLQGPAPLLRALLPAFTWRDTEGARLHIERTN